MITKRDKPCYHAGVDTIDGFCFSWMKKLTEEELDRVFDDFLVKEPSFSGKQDEQDQYDEKEADLVKGDIKKYKYCG